MTQTYPLKFDIYQGLFAEKYLCTFKPKFAKNQAMAHIYPLGDILKNYLIVGVINLEIKLSLNFHLRSFLFRVVCFKLIKKSCPKNNLNKKICKLCFFNILNIVLK